MVDVKHTPGPWEASLAADSYEQRPIYGPDHEHVANTINGSAVPGRTSANARLIAAAPDLLEALQGIVGDDDISVSLAEQRGRWLDRMKVAQAAIAKALGEGGAVMKQSKLDIARLYALAEILPNTGLAAWTVSVKAAADRLLDLEGALFELGRASASYRELHDRLGDDHIDAGRAWDVLRRAEDRALKIFAGASIEEARS